MAAKKLPTSLAFGLLIGCLSAGCAALPLMPSPAVQPTPVQPTSVQPAIVPLETKKEPTKSQTVLKIAAKHTAADSGKAKDSQEDKEADERPPVPAPALFIPGNPERPVFAQPQIAESTVETIALPVPGAAPPAPKVTQVVALGPVVPVAQNTAPTASPPAQQPAPQMSPIRYLYEQAARQYAGVSTYMMRLKRREVVGGQARPEEVMLCKIRRNPQSVYLKWLSGEGQNREVVYVKGQHEDKIHTLTAARDVPFLPAGRHFKVAPDSVMVKARSRYPITNAGIGSLIDRYGRLVALNDKGDVSEGTAKYLGRVNRPEFQTPLDAVLQAMPPGADPLFPRGGQRFWFFDPTLHFPVLVITLDENGRENEYYCHDRFLLNVKLDDDDFTPQKLWKNAVNP